MPKDSAISSFLKKALKVPPVISTMHLVSALEATKQCKPLSKFDPEKTGNFELFLCSMLLHRLEQATYHPKHLSQIAYISFILDCVTFIGVADISIDHKIVVNKYKKHAIALGLYDKKKKTFTINPDELVVRAMSHPEIYGIPNIVKAIFLVQYINLVILPSALNRLPKDDNISFKEHSTSIQQYYEHLTSHFIPSLFTTLRSPGIIANFRILGQLSKLLINFPTQLFPQIEEFIKKLNKFAVNHINSLSEYELFSLLKLNEITEICHGKKFLSKTDKEIILKHVLNRVDTSHTFNEALMYMQYTIFRDHSNKIAAIFKWRFELVRSNKQLQFDSSKQVHYTEEVMYNALLQHLAPTSRACVYKSYICPITGKEIDLVIIIPGSKYKIAINIDGKDCHFDPWQDKENYKTMIRNAALKNSGWIVICQTIPRHAEGFHEKIKRGLIDEVRHLLNNLRTLVMMSTTLQTVMMQDKVGPRVLRFLDEDDVGYLSLTNGNMRNAVISSLALKPTF